MAENRPKLVAASEEMKQWSAMLSSEVTSWPGVSLKPMFGLTAFYVGEQIFACVPKTKSFETPSTVAFRFDSLTEELKKGLESDSKVISNPIGSRWISFSVNGPADLNAALQWFSLAYENAKRKRPAKAIRRSQKKR